MNDVKMTTRIICDQQGNCDGTSSNYNNRTCDRHRSSVKCHHQQRGDISWHVIIAVVVLIFCLTCRHVTCSQDINPTLVTSEQTEYCQWETFNATCERGEVIVMVSARYGRMRFGRCVREDHGNHGCYADVTPHMDRRCSGRQSCTMVIPDATLHASHPCPKELMPYLDASYSCVKVHTGNRHYCEIFGERRVTSETGGYMGLLDAHDDALVGTEACPWLISVDDGRRVTINLLNFDLQQQRSSYSLPSSSSTGQQQVEAEACPYEVVFEESSTAATGSNGRRTQHTASVCDSRVRESVIHVSETNTVKVFVRKLLDRKPHFLLRYDVSGCATLHTVPYGWPRRQGDTTLVTCNATGNTYFLSCVNGQWVGNVDNCTSTTGRETSDRQELAHWRFPTGILLMIGVGVSLGVALGIFMLFGILFCLKKDGEREQQSATNDPLLGTNKLNGDSATLYDVRNRDIDLAGGSFYGGRVQKPDLYADAPSCNMCHTNSSSLVHVAPASSVAAVNHRQTVSPPPEEACLYGPQSDDQKLYQSARTLSGQVTTLANGRPFATFRPSFMGDSRWQQMRTLPAASSLTLGQQPRSTDALLLECKCSSRQPLDPSNNATSLPPSFIRSSSLDEHAQNNNNINMSIV